MSRSRRLAKGIGTSAISRGLGAIAPLVTVPVALSFLGVSAYGAWTAALALTSLATFADLGIGAGLMTRLADALAGEDIPRARHLVSSAYAALAGICVILLVALWSSTFWIDWSLLIANTRPEPGVDTEIVVLVTMSAFIVSIFTGLIVRVQYGAQQVSASNLWIAAGNLLGIGATFAAAAFATSQGMFIAIASFTPVLVAVINAVWFFVHGAGISFRPRINAASWAEIGKLTALGSRFLFITVLMAATLSTDTWIVAQTTSLQAATEYSIPARIFAIIGVAVSVMTIPLWPSNAEAIRNGDLAWVRRTTRRMTVISPVVAACLGIIAVLAGPALVNVWLGGRVTLSVTLAIGLALWAVSQAVIAPAFMVQNSVEVLRPQLIGYAILLIAIPVKFYVAATWGFEWLPYASTALYCLIVWPAAIVGYRRAMVVAGSRAARVFA